MSPDSPPLCINCKHHQRLISDWCSRKVRLVPNLVDGTVKETGSEWASVERLDGLDTCGEKGKYFEPKVKVIEHEPLALPAPSKKPWWHLW